MPKMRDTSLLAYDYIMQEGKRETTYKKIVVALSKIISGTSWDIATACELAPDKVWKRMKELEEAGTVFDTGKRLNSPNGRPAAVWALTKNKHLFSQYELPFSYSAGQTTAADFASLLINKQKNKKRGNTDSQ